LNEQESRNGDSLDMNSFMKEFTVVKRIFLVLAALLLVVSQSYATITVVKATNYSNSYMAIYRGTFSTSATLTALDTIVIVNENGQPFDLTGMADSLVTIQLMLKPGATVDSAHVQVTMHTTDATSPRVSTLFAGYEWRVVNAAADSDGANFHNAFITNKTTGSVAAGANTGNVTSLPSKVKFGIAEYNMLNEYITTSNPAQVTIKWRKKFER